MACRFSNDESSPIVLGDDGEEATDAKIRVPKKVVDKEKKVEKDVVIKKHKQKKEKDVGKKRKQVEVDSGDDFESPNKQSKRNIPKPIPRKPFINFENKRLKLRCNPGKFVDVIKSLSEKQVEAVKEMGFESILSFNIVATPTRLAYWLLVNYDEDRNELNIGNRIIKITPSLVKDCMGIPMRCLTVFEKNKPRKGVDVRTDEFKNQFEETRISVYKVMKIVEKTSEGGRLFNTNFLVIFTTMLGLITSLQPLIKESLGGLKMIQIYAI
ncbi:uncharacterized protein LOC143592047 [Bidens hawaiensis]|uniref:uncharacterized protein LOC143592047 n=1 Tax=Bidens hawaiensis TaxID=980011 RepID=UPI00404AB7E3